MMVPGPAQAAAVAALDDDDTSSAARALPPRLERWPTTLARGVGIEVPMPAGGFYLWFDADDAWAFTERLAARVARWSAPASSTARPAPGTFASRWYSRTIASSFVAGLIGAGVLFFLATQRPSTAVERFARAAAGCTTTLDFQSTGTYYVYEELDAAGSSPPTGARRRRRRGSRSRWC
jgi:hypothetical protein